MPPGRDMSGVPPVAGALLGSAAGEVLGMAGGAGAAEDHGPPGEATRQALVVAYHLMENGRIVPEALGSAFVALDRAGGIRSTRAGFAAFVAALAGGASLEHAAQPSGGNGAAVRSAPIGIHVHRARHRLIDEAISAAAVTHADPRGVAAGVAIPAAVALAADGVEGPDLVFDVAEEVTEAEHHVFAGLGLNFAPGDRWHTLSTALRAAAPLAGSDPSVVAETVGRHAAATAAGGSPSGTDRYAVASVVTAIVVGAGGGDDPAAVVAATSLGGDAPSVGAMVGAILGARRGAASWPWEVPDAATLLEIGRRLAAGDDGSGLPDLYELESLS